MSKELSKYSTDNGYTTYTSTDARKAAETDMQANSEKDSPQIVCEYLNHGNQLPISITAWVPNTRQLKLKNLSTISGKNLYGR